MPQALCGSTNLEVVVSILNHVMLRLVFLRSVISLYGNTAGITAMILVITIAGTETIRKSYP